MAIELHIGQLGPKGDGIHQGSEGRIYVDRALPGDLVRAKVRQDDQGLTRGEIVDILIPSEFRTPPPCPYYDRCGNCTLQHVTPDYYRTWKLEVVKEALAKQGLRPEQWLEPVFIEGGRRRRATFSAYRNRHEVTLGYYRRRSKAISDIDECLVADPRLMEIRNLIKPHLAPILTDGRPLDIFVQLVGDDVDVVVKSALGPKAIAALELILSVTPITRIAWEGGEIAKGPVIAKFGALRVYLPPGAFLQPTPEGEKTLVDAVMSALPSTGKFADLFSGSGTFSGPMLGKGSVDAYESEPSAVSALTKAGRDRKLGVFRRDLYVKPLRGEELNRYDAVVFDPPRGGCPEQAVQMASAKTPLLVGVSCNPATFARDARLLRDGGYRLKSVQVVDQFKFSHHVEIVGVFTKQAGASKP